MIERAQREAEELEHGGWPALIMTVENGNHVLLFLKSHPPTENARATQGSAIGRQHEKRFLVERLGWILKKFN